MTEDAIIRFLPWDSEFFGRRIARLSVETLTSEIVSAAAEACRAEKIDCLYFLASPDDDLTVRLAEEHGYHQTDIRVTLDGLTAEPKDAETATRAALEADIPELVAMARINHRDTRFYYDGRFPRERCDNLYGTWIENSCRGWADHVLVAGEPGRPEGYITCHLRDGAGQIGLVGVGTAFQRKGLGPLLVREALCWFREKGVRTVTVVTQGRNCTAQRLYQKCEFMTRHVQLWYHKWF